MNIVLCGMMGCGKTTVGKELAAQSSRRLIDIDSLIVQRYGVINDIFAKHGEEYFRNLETEITKEVADGYSDAVISLGGGCVLRQINVDNLKKSGKIFYLRTSAQTLISRLEGDKDRPLLQGGVSKKVNEILPVRAPIYEGVADVIIDTDNLSPKQIATKILEYIK